MGKKINILYFRNSLDASDYYRGTNALSDLEKLGEVNIRIVSINNWDETDIYWSDIAYFQRPCSGEQCHIMNVTKGLNRLVWCDWDDDLINVPPYNPSYVHYQNLDPYRMIFNSICQSDLITVSTETLKNQMEKIAKQAKKDVPINVLPNGNLYPPGYRLEYSKPMERILAWRGSLNHHGDVDHYLEVIKEYLEKHKIIFIGDLHPSLYKYRNAINIKYDSIYDYSLSMRTIKADGLLVLLKDSNFNRAKSNISYIEAANVQLNTIVPDLPSFKGSYSMKYKPNDLLSLDNTLKQFQRATKLELRKRAEDAKEQINELYNPFNLSIDRMNIIRQIL